ncbi:catechol 2,3-dioxygenase-like lactoylglutathione lyase family enzyme [Allocatelliglobosispora scoriae]|uniref:Catechol 2,3-dioxygenase-like lactoylglutathione lyase family enzyme n=1 Tax=Allocatelliglobosispora scoriae TaxID=643052 RepID=A0A841C110_9ACTN|nr:VOC family protein [Allocatelliglobosispora scoriae]MBB5873615.1 catechol 2,3-dioxygenase-like lactoylglutathione lyase family enzyme [Allocatelliglobosispora scoriae]
MDIRLSHTFLAVDDPDKSVEFYRDVLGLEVRNDVGYEKMRWITIGSPSQPEVDIVLEPPAANPNMSPQDKDAVADLMAKGLYGTVVFWTDNCDETFERVLAAGADVIQEPMDQPYGVRDCAFRDPAGNQVRFTEAKR